MGRIELPSMVYETIALPLSYIGISNGAGETATLPLSYSGFGGTSLNTFKSPLEPILPKISGIEQHRAKRKRSVPFSIALRAVESIGKISENLILERDTGVEPVFLPWEGNVEPLN